MNLGEQVGLLVRENQGRLKAFGFFEFEHGVTNNDDDVVDGNFSRGWPIEADHACLALAFDDVGFKTLAVIDIDNLNALTFDEVGGIHEVFIDGDTADVVEVGLRYAYPMNF